MFRCSAICALVLFVAGCGQATEEDKARELLKQYMRAIETTTIGGEPNDILGWSKHRLVPLEADYDFQVTKSVNRPYRATAKVLYRYEFIDTLLHPLKSREEAIAADYDSYHEYWYQVEFYWQDGGWNLENAWNTKTSDPTGPDTEVMEAIIKACRESG